jgi:hypothetical protein
MSPFMVTGRGDGAGSTPKPKFWKLSPEELQPPVSPGTPRHFDVKLLFRLDRRQERHDDRPEYAKQESDHEPRE